MLLGLGQTVPGHLNQLMMNKADDGDVVMVQADGFSKLIQLLVLGYELGQLLLHLLGGLGEPLLVEGVHQHNVIVYQGSPDGRTENEQ